MARRVWTGLLIVGVVLLAVAAPLVVVSRASAQGTPSDTIAGYLDRMGVSWKRSEKDADLLIVTKTTGLAGAERVELYIYNYRKTRGLRFWPIPS